MKWQLFASPEEVAGGGSFVAFIKDGGIFIMPIVGKN